MIEGVIKQIDMKDRTRFIEAAQLHIQAAELIIDTVALQHQILVCQKELIDIINLGHAVVEADRIRDLRDEIFGCRIEMEAKRLHAHRLRKEAAALRKAAVY